MKDKIELLAKGVFTFDRPELVTSVGNISISVEMGKSVEGSFTVSSSADKPFKGLVYATDSLISFDTNSFFNASNTINYKFDATHLDIGDSVKGRITIVSELGELDIPFQAKVRVPSCDTSVGPASDLFHFANLAQTDWSEAKNLFKSEEFGRTLSFYDSKFDTLYRALMRSGNNSLALEELLTAAHKKKPVSIKCEKNELSYEMPATVLKDSITITRDSWGYLQLTVETEGEFLSVERNIIWMDDFTGDDFKLELAIDPAKMHGGTNLGTIRISSVRETLTLSVIVKGRSDNLKERLARRKMRHVEMKILNNYMDLCFGRISQSKFVTEEEKELDKLRVYRPQGVLDRLTYIWLQLLSGREPQAVAALGIIFEDEDWGDDAFAFALALYLKALADHESLNDECGERLRNLYESTLDARIYLMYMGLDRKNRLSNNAKFDALRKAIRRGQTSPTTLFVACRIVNDEPTVLKEFTGFDLQVVCFGIKHKMITRNALIQIAYLAAREKTTSSLMISTLEHACEIFHTNEILEALCIHLIRGSKHDKTAFKWLSIGVNEQISAKNLYESCMKAWLSCRNEALPRGVQTYFETGVDLPDDIKSVFYAESVRRKTPSDGTSLVFMGQIREYAIKRLSEGAIDDNLAVLYNNVIEESDITPAVTAVLPDVVFKHKITGLPECTQSVLVAHKELENELSFPVRNGEAYADIVTEEFELLAEDGHGNRIVPARYSSERMITNPCLLRAASKNCTEDIRILLSELEGARYRGDAELAITLVGKIVYAPGLEKHFEIECRRELIEYYYENLEGELMEDLLVHTDLSVLSRRDRARMIDLMILRELYSLAVHNMELYGNYGVDSKRIAKLTSRLIETGDQRVGSEIFTELCFRVFQKKKHDDSIVKYLVRYYNADSESMYQVWRAAIDAGINAEELEERLLAQILFTENDMSYSRDIFRHYYGHGGNRKLIKAFLSCYAYKYLVCDQLPDESMLELMRRESVYDENDLCVLAILKFYSTQEELQEPDRNYVEQRMLLLEHKGVIMPFFRNFKNGIHIPEGMQDKQYVEYHTNPAKRVRIHYCMLTGESGDNGYVEEDMHDLGYGIFVSEFVLFYGEILQYYITEDVEGEAVITESGELCIEPEMIGNEETGYHQLNLMITAREMNDSKTMQRLMETYIRNEYISKKMFNPLF